jgi:hypothetical protein
MSHSSGLSIQNDAHIYRTAFRKCFFLLLQNPGKGSKFKPASLQDLPDQINQPLHRNLSHPVSIRVFVLVPPDTAAISESPADPTRINPFKKKRPFSKSGIDFHIYFRNLRISLLVVVSKRKRANTYKKGAQLRATITGLIPVRECPYGHRRT